MCQVRRNTTPQQITSRQSNTYKLYIRAYTCTSDGFKDRAGEHTSPFSISSPVSRLLSTLRPMASTLRWYALYCRCAPEGLRSPVIDKNCLHEDRKPSAVIFQKDNR